MYLYFKYVVNVISMSTFSPNVFSVSRLNNIKIEITKSINFTRIIGLRYTCFHHFVVDGEKKCSNNIVKSVESNAY